MASSTQSDSVQHPLPQGGSTCFCLLSAVTGAGVLPPLQQEPPPSSSSAEPGQGSLHAAGRGPGKQRGSWAQRRGRAGARTHQALTACLKARGNAAAGGQREELWSQGNCGKPLAMTMAHREEGLWLRMLPGQGHTLVLRWLCQKNARAFISQGGTSPWGQQGDSKANSLQLCFSTTSHPSASHLQQHQGFSHPVPGGAVKAHSFPPSK